MKKYIIMLVTLVSLSAFGQSKTYQIGKDGYEWYLVKDGEKYGVQDKCGNVLIPVEYDSITRISTGLELFEKRTDRIGYFKVLRKVPTNNYGIEFIEGIYSSKGDCLISPEMEFLYIQSEYIEDIGYCFVGEHAPARADGKGYVYMIFDKEGTLVYITSESLELGHLELEYHSPSKKMFYIIRKVDDRKYGIMDMDGNIVLQPKFQRIDYDPKTKSYGTYDEYESKRKVLPLSFFERLTSTNIFKQE